jgi:2-methylcitrate dehydratase PrpD
MCGILSAMLAEKGFNGPSTIIEGEAGFLNAYSFRQEYDKSSIARDFGATWHFSESSIKVYPCCRYSGGHLDACLDIVEKYHPDPKRIRKIFIRSSGFTIKLLTLPLERKLEPQTSVDAQFSMPYQAAAALTQGKVDIKTFTEENFRNPEILALVPKVEWAVDDEFERRYPSSYSCAVTVTMENGQEFTSVVDNPKGDYRNPVTQREIEDKFISLARMEISEGHRIKKIMSYVGDLEKADDVNELFSLIAT